MFGFFEEAHTKWFVAKPHPPLCVLQFNILFFKCNNGFIILIEVTEYPSTFKEKICVRIATGTGVISVENDIGMETNQLHARRTNKSACKDNKMSLSQENTSLKPNQNP